MLPLHDELILQRQIQLEKVAPKEFLSPMLEMILLYIESRKDPS